MDDPVVQQLATLIKTHGRALLNDRGKLDALLADSTAAYPNKVKALLLLLEKNIVGPMLGLSNDAAGASSLATLRRNSVPALAQSGAITDQAANWAFDGWASALGLSTANAGATDISLTEPAAAPAAAATNVYAPPTARVADPRTASLADGNFLPDARGVDAGRGWQWIVDGWNLFKGNWLIWIVNVVIFFVINLGLQIIPFIGWIGAMLISAPMLAGLMIGADAIRRGETLTVNHLFAGFQERLKPLILVSVIYAGAIIVVFLVFALFFGAGMFFGMASGDMGMGMASMGLGILVMLALMIPIFMAYIYAPALVALNGMDAIPAMKASFGGCLKNILPGIVWGLVYLVAAIVATIPVGLGWFVLVPVMVASLYASYRDIFYQP